MQILLNDLLQLSEAEIANAKIKFNMHNGDKSPLELYQECREELMSWQFWNGQKRSFYEGQLAIGLVRIHGNQWLLFDISRITRDLEIQNGVGYEYDRIDRYAKFFGRAIVEFKNRGQQNVRNASSVLHDCKVLKVLDSQFDKDVFPGYENVRLTWQEMVRVIEKDTWRTALSNQKGVYLITDTENGKMYVGAAYGSTMLLGRWRQYATGHSGLNKQLIEIDKQHIEKYFTYSILDIFKSTIEDEVIIQRESWWKRTLLTREFGYNAN